MSSPEITFAARLDADALVARKKSMPVLLYFSDPHCGYCRSLEKDIFLPMLRSGDYQDRVILRKVSWLSHSLVRDFTGSELESRTLADQYHVQVTPTMIFVDDQGVEVAKRILGYNGPDLFWFYLDRSIDEGRSTMLQKIEKQ